jgi:hypothetical protein
MNITGLRIGFAAALACLTIAGCDGGGAAVSGQTATLSVALTDGPLSSATKVWLQFSGVEVKPVGGSAQTFNFSPAKGFDLLTLRNGNAAMLLGDTTMPAGDYEWIRLMLDSTAGSSYVIDSTGQHSLRMPSGAETGLKLVRGFTMPAGGRADFTVDFVLDKSILTPPGQSPEYMMKPVLRITDNIQVGKIAGTFAANALTAIPACTGKAPSVYLYSGANVVPDDIFNPLNGAADTAPTVDPLVTTTAAINGSGVYAYQIAYVPIGTYTVAFTCDNDDPVVDENAVPATPLNFVVYAQPVVVSQGQTSTANF